MDNFTIKVSTGDVFTIKAFSLNDIMDKITTNDFLIIDNIRINVKYIVYVKEGE